jgi:hypothetical protein
MCPSDVGWQIKQMCDAFREFTLAKPQTAAAEPVAPNSHACAKLRISDHFDAFSIIRITNPRIRDHLHSKHDHPEGLY